jgi:hypothetical protein
MLVLDEGCPSPGDLVIGFNGTLSPWMMGLDAAGQHPRNVDLADAG